MFRAWTRPAANTAVDRIPFIDAYMFEDRDIRIDVAAIVLLMVTAFLGLALLTHNASDPPVQLVSPFNRLYQQDVLHYPVAETTTNACGPWGSVVSAVMFDGFGVGAWYVCLLYTSPSPRDATLSRMPSSA